MIGWGRGGGREGGGEEQMDDLMDLMQGELIRSVIDIPVVWELRRSEVARFSFRSKFKFKFALLDYKYPSRIFSDLSGRTAASFEPRSRISSMRVGQNQILAFYLQ